jgi:hypothetical protein
MVEDHCQWNFPIKTERTFIQNRDNGERTQGQMAPFLNNKATTRAYFKTSTMVDWLHLAVAIQQQTTDILHTFIFSYVLERPHVSHSSVAFVPFPTQLQVS